MIGLVRPALRRRCAPAIAAMLIILLGALSLTRMIVEIFPVIDIPRGTRTFIADLRDKTVHLQPVQPVGGK